MPEQHASARETEYRLRSWLNGRQPDQEGMCLQLLPTLGPYTRCRPRRPKGGPDGGRDLEAVHEGQFEVWGAVGFENNASSNSEHRAQAARKFKADLARALLENPDLSGFVFFTNVDLTTSAKAKLLEWARGQSQTLKHVEIFDFEVLRSKLDSQEGLIPRLQFLDIEMSKTEQVALFDRYGTQMLNALHQRFDDVGKLIEKLEDLASFSAPLSEIDLRLALDPPLTSWPEPLMCLARFDSIFSGIPQGDDSFAVLCQVEEKAELGMTVRSFLWNRCEPGALEAAGTTGQVWLKALYEIAGGIFIRRVFQGTRVTVGSLLVDNRIELFANPALRRFAQHTRLTLNDYTLFELEAPREEHYSYPLMMEWPSDTPEVLSQTDWITLTRGATFPSISMLLHRRR
jgi:hypothetical protein